MTVTEREVTAYENGRDLVRRLLADPWRLMGLLPPATLADLEAFGAGFAYELECRANRQEGTPA